MSCPACRYARRNLLALLAGAGAAPLAACSDPGQLGGSLVSPRQEQQMGAQEFAKLRHQRPRSANTGYQRELQAVGQRIVAAQRLADPARSVGLRRLRAASRSTPSPCPAAMSGRSRA